MSKFCIFTNASEFGLVTARLGFPFCDRYSLCDPYSGAVAIPDLKSRKNRIINPVIKNITWPANSTTVFQPIFRIESTVAPQLYNSDFVQSHSLNPAHYRQ